jgi:Rad3-related DNA helicase
MPYNYLIDEKIRENYEISFSNSCIIFDEGHNASSTAEDVASFEIMTELLLQAETDLLKLQDERKIRNDDQNTFKSTDEDTSNLMTMIRTFYRYLEDYELDQS